MKKITKRTLVHNPLTEQYFLNGNLNKPHFLQKINTFEWDFEQTTEKLRIIQNSQIFIKHYYFHQIMDRIKILVIGCKRTFSELPS